MKKFTLPVVVSSTISVVFMALTKCILHHYGYSGIDFMQLLGLGLEGFVLKTALASIIEAMVVNYHDTNKSLANMVDANRPTGVAGAPSAGGAEYV